jgi:hypothetical protein
MKKLRFFSSFEEQKQAEITTTLSMSYQERVIDAVQLIKRIYKIASNEKKDKPKRLVFTFLTR